MDRNIALAGGRCSPQRIQLSARRFEELKGKDALVAFLRATAGVSRVDDLSQDDRFRINRAMREHLHETESQPLNRIRAKAFAKMGRWS